MTNEEAERAILGALGDQGAYRWESELIWLPGADDAIDAEMRSAFLSAIERLRAQGHIDVEPVFTGGRRIRRLPIAAEPQVPWWETPDLFE